MKKLSDYILLVSQAILAISLFSVSGYSAERDDTQPVIVKALFQDSQPKYFDKEDRDYYKVVGAGICGDLYQAMAEKLAARKSAVNLTLKVESRYIPIKRILKTIEYDPAVFCGAGRNAEREQRFIYSSTPVYHVSNVIARRKDDPFEPKKLLDLEGNTQPIGVLYGTSSAKFLSGYKNIMVADHFTHPLEGLKAVAVGKVPGFFYHDMGIHWLIASNKLPLRVGKARFRTIPQWLIMSKELPEAAVRELDEIVGELYESGDIYDIQMRYRY